jgi:cytochrome b involved in lipid metabolism
MSEYKYLTRIDGKVYALDSFLERHPGGRDLVILATNRDASGED